MRALWGRFAAARTGRWAILQTAVANVAVQGLNLASGVLTARTLGPSGRGTLAGIIMWPQFLAYAMSLGIPVATVFWLKRKPHEAAELAGAGWMLSLIFGLLAGGIGFVAVPYSLHAYSPAVIHIARLWVIVTPLELFAVVLIAQVQAADAFANYNLYRFFSPFCVLLVLLAAAALGKLSYAVAAGAYLIGGLPMMVWVGWWCFQNFRPSIRNFAPTSRLLLSYGARAWGGDLLGTVASQIDRVLVVGLLSPESMGLYVIAQSAAGVLAVLPTAVAPITLPKSSGLSTEGILEITGNAVRATLCAMVVASLPLLFCGGLLIHLVYGSKFSPAASVLPFLVIEAILSGLTSVLSQAFLAAGFPGVVSLLQGCGLMTSIPLLYALIPRFGLRGAGCALMLSTLCRFGLVLINFPLRLKTRPPGLLMSRAEFLNLWSRLMPRMVAAESTPPAA